MTLHGSAFAAVPHPLGVIPYFTQHTVPVTLDVIRHKTIGSEEYEINDAASGARLLHVSGGRNALSRTTKVMSDASGAPIMHINRHLMPRRMVGEDPTTGTELFEISKSAFGGPYVVSYRNATNGRMEEFSMQGNGLTTGGRDVTYGGTLVGQVTHGQGSRGEYQITAAPHVDLTLLVALCLSMEARRQGAAVAAG